MFGKSHYLVANKTRHKRKQGRGSNSQSETTILLHSTYYDVLLHSKQKLRSLTPFEYCFFWYQATFSYHIETISIKKNSRKWLNLARVYFTITYLSVEYYIYLTWGYLSTHQCVYTEIFLIFWFSMLRKAIRYANQIS